MGAAPEELSEAGHKSKQVGESASGLKRFQRPRQPASTHAAGIDPSRRSWFHMLLFSVSGLGVCGLHCRGENPTYSKWRCYSFSTGPHGHESQLAWQSEPCELQPLGRNSRRPSTSFCRRSVSFLWTVERKLRIQFAPNRHLSVTIRSFAALRLHCSRQHPTSAQFASAGLCPIIS